MHTQCVLRMKNGKALQQSKPSVSGKVLPIVKNLNHRSLKTICLWNSKCLLNKCENNKLWTNQPFKKRCSISVLVCFSGTFNIILCMTIHISTIKIEKWKEFSFSMEFSPTCVCLKWRMAPKQNWKQKLKTQTSTEIFQL